MPTLNDNPEEQHWNYPKISRPSGPSARSAGVSVVAVNDEKRFEGNGEENIPSTFHCWGVSSNESYREEGNCVSLQTPLNVVSQRENIPCHVPYGEEIFVGASVNSRLQGQRSVRYNANDYTPRYWGVSRRGRRVLLADTNPFPNDRVQTMWLHTGLTPYSSEDPSVIDHQYGIEHNSGVFPITMGQTTGDDSSPVSNSPASSPAGGPVYPQPVYPQPVYSQPVYSQPVYSQPVYPQPISPFVHRVHHLMTPTRSPSTANHSFGDQQYDISVGAHEVRVDFGNGGDEFVAKSPMHESPRCQYCGKSVRALNRHIRDVHQNRTIDCPEDGCKRKGSKGFGRLDNLRDHLRRVHDIPIPKICRRKKKEAE